MITALFARGSFIQFQSLFKFCFSLLGLFCSLEGGHMRRYAPGLQRTHQQLFFTHEKTNFSVKSSLQSRHQFFFLFVFVWVSLYRARQGNTSCSRASSKISPFDGATMWSPQKIGFQLAWYEENPSNIPSSYGQGKRGLWEWYWSPSL